MKVMNYDFLYYINKYKEKEVLHFQYIMGTFLSKTSFFLVSAYYFMIWR
jgi:hypothetical protein